MKGTFFLLLLLNKQVINKNLYIIAKEAEALFESEGCCIEYTITPVRIGVL
jgi:hypothetical protein